MSKTSSCRRRPYTATTTWTAIQPPVAATAKVGAGSLARDPSFARALRSCGTPLSAFGLQGLGVYPRPALSYE